MRIAPLSFFGNQGGIQGPAAIVCDSARGSRREIRPPSCLLLQGECARNQIPKTDRRTPTVMPAIRLNANDVRRGTGGTALRRLRISSTNVAQIITREAYAKVMGWHSTQVWGRLLYRSLSCLTSILKACINEDRRALVRGTNRHTENPRIQQPLQKSVNC